MVADRPRGRRWQALRERVFARYGTTCHWCHHGGAEQIDHLLPFIDHPRKALQIGNLRPIHGRRCPVCGVGCNAQRRSSARRPVVARVAAETRQPAAAAELPQGWTIRVKDICNGTVCAYGGTGAHPPGRCWLWPSGALGRAAAAAGVGACCGRGGFLLAGRCAGRAATNGRLAATGMAAVSRAGTAAGRCSPDAAAGARGG
jgi:hypothetical protein